jgi:hypothetical protein
MKKYSWIVALLLALSLAFVFVGCGDPDDKDKDKDKVDPNLQDLVVDGADIVLKYAGNKGKAEHVDGNKFILVEQDDLSNVGFYWEFPAEAVGKGYGAINIEMEVISIDRPDFIGLMTFSSSSFSGGVNILDKKTGQQKTGDYDNEFKLGVECEKGATGDTAEGGDGILDGSSEAGVKHDESYPFVKFSDKIAFQCNRYAGNITTAGWTQGSTEKATFTIAVTKVTFVGGAVPDSVVDVKAIPGVTPPASGATPVAAITETAQFTGAVAWKDAAGTAVGATYADGVVYTATITLTAKEGFTFEGVAADFFTVAGATTVNNAKDSGVVTAVFPATEAPATALTVTVGGVEKQTTSLTAPSGTVTLLNDGSGYTYEYGTGGYRNGYAVFKIDLGGALSGFESVDFTYDFVAGDGKYKPVYVYASSATFTGDLEATTSTATLIGSLTTGNPVSDGNANSLSVPITAAGVLSGELFFAIAVPGKATDNDVATSYTISDIEFVEAE